MYIYLNEVLVEGLNPIGSDDVTVVSLALSSLTRRLRLWTFLLFLASATRVRSDTEPKSGTTIFALRFVAFALLVVLVTVSTVLGSC